MQVLRLRDGRYDLSGPFDQAEDPLPRQKKEAIMRFKAKNIAALDIALAGLPDQTRVDVEPDIEVSAKTVGELRKLTEWPENLAITIPRARHDEMAVYVSKASIATRVVSKS